MNVEFRPVDRDRWPDLEKLFSESAGEELGNPSRCWCMELRLGRHADWADGAGDVNRQRLRRLVASGEIPGLLAYDGGEPVGWVSVSPRPTLIGIKRFQSAERFDDPAVWSVTCFYVPERYRGRGTMATLLEAARDYAIARGARTVEGYPPVPELADDGAAGTVPVFERAGFVRVREIRPGWFVMQYGARTAAPG